VLLYSFVEASWPSDMVINFANCPLQHPERVTVLQWKAAQTAVIMGRLSRILHGGNRSLLWAVYSYLHVEASHLNCISSL
jgi:hypothetical protein